MKKFRIWIVVFIPLVSCDLGYGEQMVASRAVEPLPNTNILQAIEDKGKNIENDREGNCGIDEAKAYLSPFSSSGEKSIFWKIESYGLNKEKVCFAFRLPDTAILGYSDEARLDYIKEVGIDPLDLFYTESVDTADPYISWGTWKISKATATFNRVVKHFNLKYPKQSLSICVQADWLVLSQGVKARRIEDWPSWAKTGLMDEVILEGEWDKPENKKLIALAREALKGTKVKMSLALDTRRNGKAIDPLTQLLNLQGEQFAEVYVKVENDADLPRAQEFVKNVLPEFDFGLTADLDTAPVVAPIKTNP